MNVVHDLIERVRRLPPLATDGALAILLAFIEVSVAWLADPAVLAVELPGFDGPNALTVLVASAATLPLTFRRLAPIPVLVVVSAAVLLAPPLDVPLVGLGLVAAIYSVGATCGRNASLWALGTFTLVVLVGLFLADSLQFAFVSVVIFVSAWVLGDRMQARRAYTVELERRAAQLEREREDKAALAVAAERQRIARELHDVVAHSVSVMVVQTAAARRVLRASTERADDALAQVEATGRDSLVELRRMLGVLRSGGDRAPVLAPQPRLEFVTDLVESFRQTGLDVDFAVDGSPRPLPLGVDLSAYRIVQEALTNSLKHAGPAKVQVRLAYRPAELVVDVRDDGRGPRPGSSENGENGHGLVGMRERVGLLGGTLRVGPRLGGGFEVEARLPVGGVA